MPILDPTEIQGVPKPMRPMITFVLSTLLLGGCSAVWATKCPFFEYEIHGVLEIPHGIDPSTIRVAVFVDDFEQSGHYPPEGNEDFAVPDRLGSFSRTLHLSTAGARGCGRILEEVVVVITGEGLESRRVAFHPRLSRGEIKKQSGAKIQLPEIRLQHCSGCSNG